MGSDIPTKEYKESEDLYLRIDSIVENIVSIENPNLEDFFKLKCECIDLMVYLLQIKLQTLQYSLRLPILDDNVSSGSPKSTAFISWSKPINIFKI